MTRETAFCNDVEEFGRIQYRNTIGPKTEPWGTPSSSCHSADRRPLYSTRCERPYRNDAMVIDGDSASLLAGSNYSVYYELGQVTFQVAHAQARREGRDC